MLKNVKVKIIRITVLIIILCLLEVVIDILGICSAQAPAELIRGLSILSMAGMLVLVLVIIIMLSSSMHYILQEFKTVEDAARENDRMNREMLANISHDLRTPLTSIKGYAHGLLDGTASSTEDSYKYLTIIRNKADDMTHLVDEMSFYAQIYQKEHDYSTKTVNANEYFSKCISQASIDLEMKKISIIYEVGISPATEINIDESKLKRVINNIIGNSSKYIQAEMGTLYISTEENENNIVVHFKDDGIGIDKKDLGHIFERLYRADASRKSETGGSGLGLSIAQKIISDHNGKIWADSKVGEGTTVSFSLPIVKNESKEKGKVIIMKNILIVEDNKEIACLEKDYLELSDFTVTIAEDGIEGEELAMTGEYDLIILDVMLPGKDGFEICKNFREKFLTPVIVVSAKKEDIDKIHGLGLGADDYMIKPFSPSELVARVKAHIARYENLSKHNAPNDDENEIINTGELTIDKTARRVFVKGEEKNFTTKEFDLLYFLAKNPNHVYPKEELFQRIWGFNSVGDIATVTVHIKKIREKIETDTSSPEYIETIWGVGYRFKRDTENR